MRIPPNASSDDGLFWNELDARFRTPLFNYFFRRVQDRSEAEDLTQETFVRLARHPDKSCGQGAQAYVFTIAANLLTDRARSRASRKVKEHRSLGDILEQPGFVRELAEDRDPERVLVARETLKDVMAALGELSERTRHIFILSRLENMQHRDIAALYGISISAVEKHVVKALASLGGRFFQR
jgi:RNA polymerase sigma-70 factor (ECF subfamily)